MTNDAVMHRCLAVLWRIYFDPNRTQQQHGGTRSSATATPAVPPPPPGGHGVDGTGVDGTAPSVPDLSAMAAEMGLVHSHVTRWGEDPYSMGSYSALPVGASHCAFEQLAAPEACYGGRLLFAGEAVSAEHPGTVRGALESGAAQATALLLTLGMLEVGDDGSEGSTSGGESSGESGGRS
jgi:hypothetical protein